MTRKAATAAQKRHMAKVANYGCSICGGIAEIHHTGTHMGGGRNHDNIIPLCHIHHRTGGHGVALHAGKKEWERLYGTEEEMLDTVRLLLDDNL